MVNIRDVRKSNLAFKLSGHASGLVAVFVGATSGIGMGTLKQYAKYAQGGKAYIVGRSKNATEPLLNELKASNPKGTFEFIETEISLIKNVDLACEEIKSKEKKIDILFLSAGFLAYGGRNGLLFISLHEDKANEGSESAEGIDIPHALRYYSRLRFVYDLLPLLTESPSPRVISILAGGKESAIDINDLEVHNDFTMVKAASNGTTQTTLAFEELAKAYPSITFIHKYPGFVNTGVIGRFLGTVTGVMAIPATIAKWAVLPIVNWFSTTTDEAGERGLFIATSARYPPSKPNMDFVGVQLPEGLEVADSSVVKDGVGNGVYRLGATDDSAPDGDVLPGYRLDEVGKTVWEQTQAVWDRALGRSA
jgi:NAD(P)-dependent dehydrogenase (short-subunit alcohol dehydrogenase family)